MGKHRLTDFESAAFKVNASKLYGVWNISRKADNAITDMETGSEGRDAYAQLKALWRADRKAFDRRCAGYTFYDETGKEIAS